MLSKKKLPILTLLIISLTFAFAHNDDSKALAGMEEINEKEVLLLASLINGEVGNEKYLKQVAVGAVVMNRVKNHEFPDTLVNVIFQSGAFKSVEKNSMYQSPPDTCINAALDAINGWDPTNGALYYWNHNNNDDKPATIVIGDFAFGLE